ncbi:MAG: ABC transporter permease subunit [Oscillospiraceae bacterium]
MKTSITINKTYQRLFKTTLAILFWLIVWQVLSAFLGNQLLLVSPIAVAGRILELGQTSAFWSSITASMLRILMGYGIGVVSAIILGALGAKIPLIHHLLAPLLAVIKSAPVASFIILALVWIKSYNLSVFISFLMVFPMVYGSVVEGIRSANGKLLQVAKVYRFSRLKTIRLVYVPALKPTMIASLSTAVGFAWKAGITGEIFALPKAAIGTMLYNAKIYLETLDVFCWTIVIVLLSLLIEKAVRYLAHKI